MNYLFLILAVPFFTLACASKPHKPEVKSVNRTDGTTQVEVRFDSKDRAAIGQRVLALNENCKTKIFRGLEKETCVENLVGTGRVVELRNDISVVVFNSNSHIGPETQFKVLE